MSAASTTRSARSHDGIAFSVAGGGRTITVTFLEGYRYAQIYTPPGGRLICFEPMTAPTNALKSGAGLETLAPGEATPRVPDRCR